MVMHDWHTKPYQRDSALTGKLLVTVDWFETNINTDLSLIRINSLADV